MKLFYTKQNVRKMFFCFNLSLHFLLFVKLKSLIRAFLLDLLLHQSYKIDKVYIMFKFRFLIYRLKVIEYIFNIKFWLE